MNDNDPSTTGLPADLMLHPAFGDHHQMLNMRDWLTKAAERAGAEFKGGSCGMGEADIDVELEGHAFNIRIRPIIKGTTI